MSKISGTGTKRFGGLLNKGRDKCDVTSHSKQCGDAREISKGHKQWISHEKEIDHTHADIKNPHQ